MNLSIKKGLSLSITILALASLVTGCSSGASGTANPRGSQGSNGNVVTIKYMRWGTQAEQDNITKILNAFMQSHPNIKVETTFTDWSNYFDKLNIAIASNTVPDVVGMSTGVGSKYYSDSTFEDLTSYMKKDNIDTSKFVPKLMDSFTLNGKVYAMPTDQAIWSLVYNKDMFDAAKIPYPAADKPMTWDQFLDIAAKFTKNGNYGYNDQNNIASRMNYFSSSYGGSMFDAQVNPKKVTIGTPEGKKALEMLTKLAKVTPPVSEWGKQWDGGLINKKAAMATDGPWSFPDYVKAGVHFGVAPIPEGVPGAPVRGMVNSVMMSKNSQHKDAAWELIKYINSVEGQKLISQYGIGIPIYPELLDSPEFLGQYKGVDMSAYKYMAQHFVPLNILPDNTVFSAFAYDQYKNLAEGKITVDQFIQRATTDGQKTLDSMYK